MSFPALASFSRPLRTGLVLLLAGSTATAQIGTVDGAQKISDTLGGFAGTLDNADLFGTSLARLGDLDGDGLTELAVGAPLDDDGGANRGAVWILFLNSDGTVASEQKISATSGGFVGPLDDADQIGIGLAALGDLDGDGVADLAVGAPLDDDGGTSRGAVWILFLNADGTVKAEQKISDTSGGLAATLDDGDQFGWSLAGFDDLDGDGIEDLAVGAVGDDDGGSGRGAAWILFLNADGTVKGEQKLSDLAGNFGGLLDDSDQFGSSLAGLPDLDGDGKDDLAVGAWLDDDGGADAGAVWILLLDTDGTVRAEQKISALFGGFTGTLDAGDRFGISAAALGRLDPDALGDLAVGAELDDDGGSDRGALWTLQLAANGTVNAHQKISSTAGNFGGPLDNSDRFGGAAAALGDLDLDGDVDLAAGARLDDDGGADRGSAWVLFLEGFAPAPVAEFTGAPTGGIHPLTVDFTDLSGSGTITTRAWDFGDGGTSSATDPSHTYTAAGSYTVSLTVSGPGGTDGETKLAYVVVSEPPPIADFSAAPTAGVRPLAVAFSDLSSGGPISTWAWDFGDGGTSSLASPSHTYTAAGTYTVSLTLSGPGGTDSESKLDLVVVGEPPPEADFAGTPQSGVTPLLVSFTDLSGGGPATAWAWDFGDGGTSSAQNPSHTFTAGGTYTVTLTASGPGGSDVESKIDYVIVSDAPPVADFAGTPTSGLNPLTVAFTELSSGGPVTSRSWNFGDGSGSTLTNPSHTYAAGTFSVSLTVSGPGGSDAETKLAYIVVAEPPPVAQFSATPRVGALPLSVAFTDASSGGPVSSRLWNFGDGATSSATNPTHVYGAVGTYTVSLTVSGPGGSDDEVKLGYIVVDLPPVADFSGTPLSGIAPVNVAFSDASSGGTITSRLWSFGDGATSTAVNPSHLYASGGTYDVSLTLTGPGGTDSEAKFAYVVLDHAPPVANFFGTPRTGVAPLTVSFTNLTSGPATGGTWDFGDGATSSELSPVHVYTTAGSFTVALTAVGPGGTDTETKLDYVVVAEGPPGAEFSASVVDGVAPLAVAFQDLSSGTVTTRSWSFGDGATSSLQDPSHVYTAAGTYTVSLTVIGPAGADTETKTGYILVRPAVAQFVGAPTSGDVPLLVSFTDLSLGTLNAWSWDFGDGASANVPNVAHLYTAPGVYAVSLTVAGPYGSDSETKLGYVHVEKPSHADGEALAGSVDAEAQADFFGRPLSGPAPLTVDFENMSRGPWGRSSWSFGDGATSNERNPVHTYTVPGLYTVALTMTRSFGAITDTETKVGYIEVTLPQPLMDGGFEDSRGASLPSPAWTVRGSRVEVRTAPGVHGLPTQGQRWAVIGSSGTAWARPPERPFAARALPTASAGLAQEFDFDPALPMLAFDAAFEDGEEPDGSARDFLSIDLSDGVTVRNLHRVESAATRTGSAAESARAAPEVVRVVRDLAELFPDATAGTRLTLWVQVGNGGADERPSFGHVDAFRLAPRATLRAHGGELDCLTASPPRSGAPWQAEVDASSIPDARATLLAVHERRLPVAAPNGWLLDLASPRLFLALGTPRDALPAASIPGDAALLGRTLHAQALVFGARGRTLCNALELVVGY